MINGETQNFPGFLSDSEVTIVERAMPYPYCLIIEHPLTKITCSGVSTDPIRQKERTVIDGETQNVQGL